MWYDMTFSWIPFTCQSSFDFCWSRDMRTEWKDWSYASFAEPGEGQFSSVHAKCPEGLPGERADKVFPLWLQYLDQGVCVFEISTLGERTSWPDCQKAVWQLRYCFKGFLMSWLKLRWGAMECIMSVSVFTGIEVQRWVRVHMCVCVFHPILDKISSPRSIYNYKGRNSFREQMSASWCTHTDHEIQSLFEFHLFEHPIYSGKVAKSIFKLLFFWLVDSYSLLLPACRLRCKRAESRLCIRRHVILLRLLVSCWFIEPRHASDTGSSTLS